MKETKGGCSKTCIRSTLICTRKSLKDNKYSGSLWIQLSKLTFICRWNWDAKRLWSGSEFLLAQLHWPGSMWKQRWATKGRRGRLLRSKVLKLSNCWDWNSSSNWTRLYKAENESYTLMNALLVCGSDRPGCGNREKDTWLKKQQAEEKTSP